MKKQMMQWNKKYGQFKCWLKKVHSSPKGKQCLFLLAWYIYSLVIKAFITICVSDKNEEQMLNELIGICHIFLLLIAYKIFLGKWLNVEDDEKK